MPRGTLTGSGCIPSPVSVLATSYGRKMVRSARTTVGMGDLMACCAGAGGGSLMSSRFSISAGLLGCSLAGSCIGRVGCCVGSSCASSLRDGVSAPLPAAEAPSTPSLLDGALSKTL